MSEVIYATGRRKTSAARVFLSEGSGKLSVNGRDLDKFFGLASTQKVATQSLDLSGLRPKLDIKVTIKGGGISGQAGAMRHAIARALCLYNEAQRPELKKAGFLTRDSRMVERKKYGQSGARKRFQFSKR